MSKEVAQKLLKHPKLRDAAANLSGATRSVPANTHLKQHGREIFVFAHLQTKQVVYSLEKSLNNNHALGQLPFNGKKTVPAGLRKDLWQPFAKIEFEATPGAASAGLNAFRKLREYRRLHELSWPESVAVDKDGKTLSRKARGRVLCDQRANSVADMAAVLESVTGKIEGKFSIVHESMSTEDRTHKRRMPAIMMKKAAAKKSEELAKAQTSEEPAQAKTGEEPAQAKAVEEPAKIETPPIRAVVKWADIYDAEYAEKWPNYVVHDTWDTTWNNRKVSPWRQKVDGEFLEPVRGGDWRLQANTT